MTMREAWYHAYSQQRRYLRRGAYYVAREHAITDALRRIFVVTRIRQTRMNSGRRAGYPETALIRPSSGERVTRWVF